MTITIDSTAINKINTLRTAQGIDKLLLRIRVEGGGCSGFQYKMELTEEKTPQDSVFDNAVIIDDISLPFLTDSTITFEEDLIGSEFKIKNPNAVSGCGCGTSFSVI